MQLVLEAKSQISNQIKSEGKWLLAKPEINIQFKLGIYFEFYLICLSAIPGFHLNQYLFLSFSYRKINVY